MEILVHFLKIIHLVIIYEGHIAIIKFCLK